jgi:molybdopterin-guanine dinucleotide biosynthesis protein
LRKAQLIIILGTNGTGKTTLLNNLLEKINRRKLILTPDYSEWTHLQNIARKDIKSFSGTKRLIYRENDFIGLNNKLRNAILVCDDFKNFAITKRREIEALRSLAIRRRQKMLDIFIVAHGFTEVVPSFLFTFADKIILFKTNDNPAKVKYRLNDFDKILETQKRVNRKASSEQHYFEIIEY